MEPAPVIRNLPMDSPANSTGPAWAEIRPGIRPVSREGGSGRKPVGRTDVSTPREEEDAIDTAPGAAWNQAKNGAL